MTQIKQIHIEPTSACQAKCSMCPRTSRIKITTTLSVSWYDSLDYSSLNKILFCGNFGDPCADKNLTKICSFIKTQNPKITIGINTNGGLQSPQWWSRLGRILTSETDYVVFSIDGLADTNHIYRKGVSWDHLMTNAKSFIAAGGNAHWDMLVFAHNQHQVLDAEALAREMGFKWFRTKITDRWDKYKTTLEPVKVFPKIIDFGRITCERNVNQSTYFDAHGREWPCCHIAEVGDTDPEISQFSPQFLLKNYNKRLKSSPYDICLKSCG